MLIEDIKQINFLNITGISDPPSMNISRKIRVYPTQVIAITLIPEGNYIKI